MKPITVYLSNKLVLLMALVGLLFVLLAVDNVTTQFIIPLQLEQNLIPQVLFLVFGFGVGGLILLSQLKLLVQKRVIFQADERAMYVATGFNYDLKPLSRDLVESIEAKDGSLVIRFKDDSAIPHGLVTSAGVSFANKTLVIRGSYMNQRPEAIRDALVS